MVKTITISDKMWEKIIKLKISLGAKTYTEVLERIFKMIQKFKLANELYDIKKGG